MSKLVISRRKFLQASALGTAALAFPFVSSRNVLGANGRLNIAGIGAGGKGAVDITGVESQNIVALCDVDEVNAAGMFKHFPNATRYKDFRILFDKEAKNIDAVTISTPDHMHAPIALWAMRMKKHVYCQKPLTHTVHEARLLTEAARKYNVATQMGNQGHSHPGTRRLVELIRGGALGKVKEIHCWTDRPIWPQGVQRPQGNPPVPGTLDWDLWLGVAPKRPYHPDYVPFKWRGYWDFGTGALGDMGCHVMDLAFFALGLRDPLSVEATTSDFTQDSPPKSSTIHSEYKLPGTSDKVVLHWYDGGRKPDASLAKQAALPSNGVIMVGDRDTLYVPSYWGEGQFLSGRPMTDFKEVPQSIARAGEFDKGHYQEWIEACKGGPAALSNFDYAGPMTEAVLLGNVAMRTGKKIQWDAKKLRVTNVAEANHYIKKQYPKGWGM